MLEQNDLLDFEVIALDDNSTDDTAVKLRDTTAANLKILNGGTLPEGWLGKNYACHQLTQHATGDYLVFVDADVRLAPNAVASSIQQMNMNINYGTIQVNNSNKELPIIVNPFGQENTSYLEPEVLAQLLESEHLQKSIPYIVKEVHINDDHPENMNIIFPNKREKFFKVKINDNTWVYKDKDDVFQMLIDSKNRILIDFFESYKDQLDTALTKNYHYLQNYLLKHDKKYIQYMKENIIRFILTHKDFMEKIAKDDQKRIQQLLQHDDAIQQQFKSIQEKDYHEMFHEINSHQQQ